MMKHILVCFLFFSLPISAGLFIKAPDGKNIIDVGDPGGYLFRVEHNIYVQTNNERFLNEIFVLINKLKSSSSGRALIRQVSNYYPIAEPGRNAARAFISLEKETKVNVVIREATAGRRFQTIALVADKTKLRYAYNGLGVPAAIYFDSRHSVNIPGTSQLVDPTVALGHELIHARDFLSGGIQRVTRSFNLPLPTDDPTQVDGQRIQFELEIGEYEATGLAYNNGNSLSLNKLTQVRKNAINERLEWRDDWEFAYQQGNVSQLEYKQVIKSLNLLEKEKPVSEFHIAKEFGAPTRDMYWPKGIYQYEIREVPSPLEQVIKSRLGKYSGKSRTSMMLSQIQQFMAQDIDSAIVLTYDALNVSKNGLSKLSNALLRLASQQNYRIYLALPEDLTAEQKLALEINLATKEKLLKSYHSQTTSEIHKLSIIEEGFSSPSIEYLADIKRIALIGNNNDQLTYPIAKWLRDSFNQKLIIARSPGSNLPNEIFDYSRSMQWETLIADQDVTLISNGSLPKAKNCWGVRL